MQKDMHYHGTYVLARAAGLKVAAAQIIASAAQYVDDNVKGEPIVLKDGARLVREATAHHVEEIQANRNLDDQRLVWVPFHFLPGNQPDGDDRDYTALLKCRKDSAIAKSMVNRAVETAIGNPIALERIGITAHVYADTFAHYGFSGVSSRRNRIDGQSFRFDHPDPSVVTALDTLGKDYFAKHDQQGGLFANIKAWLSSEELSRRAAAVKSAIAEFGSGALGHGAAATYPDQPYLVWTYKAEFPKKMQVSRSNPVDFLEACQALHDMFQRFAQRRMDYAEPAKALSFDAIRPEIERILALPLPSPQRAQAWEQSVASGALLGPGETIPPYLGPDWTRWLADADQKVDSLTALQQPACRFHMAAAAHRAYVLYELLPANKLLVA